MIDVLAAKLLGSQSPDPGLGAGFHVESDHRVGFGNDRLGLLVGSRHVQEPALVINRDRREHRDAGGAVAIHAIWRQAYKLGSLVDGIGLPLAFTGMQVKGGD